MTLTTLAGTTVVALEQYIAGPYCTQILADLGARVIKVERPGGGDPRRDYEPRIPLSDELVSGGFASYNRGKESVLADLAEPSGLERFRALLSESDVFVSNLRPGALTRLGLDPAELRERYPRLVVCEITGFGVSGGLLAQAPAFDSVIQAMSGLAGLLGDDPDGAPALAPMSIMDLLSGIWAALGISAALVERGRTGLGTHVDTAMYDVGVALMERALTLREFTGRSPERGGDEYSPVGTFRAADGRWLSIVIPTDDMWGRCCRAMGRRDLSTDPALDDTLKRAHRMKDLVLPALEEWATAESLTAEQVVDRLSAAGQPVGIVQTIDEVRNSPQLEHRGLFTPLRVRHGDDTVDSSVRLVRTPLLFDGRAATPGPLPALGSAGTKVPVE